MTSTADVSVPAAQQPNPWCVCVMPVSCHPRDLLPFLTGSNWGKRSKQVETRSDRSWGSSLLPSQLKSKRRTVNKHVKDVEGLYGNNAKQSCQRSEMGWRQTFVRTVNTGCHQPESKGGWEGIRLISYSHRLIHKRPAVLLENVAAIIISWIYVSLLTCQLYILYSEKFLYLYLLRNMF